jgi:hypothetical protein
MTTIRKIVTSKIDGNSANNTTADEIRPFGETAFYVDTDGDTDKLVLSIHDGVRTHLKSKVVGPGVLYGSNADSGDGNNYDTIKLIPDAELQYNDGTYNNDQYLIVDPTAPNHVHLRAGGTIDNSNAALILGGENSNVEIQAGENPPVYVRANNNTWMFDVDGSLAFSDNTVQTTAWAGGRVVSAPVSSTGAVGDQQGDLAFDNTHIYYCIADYNQLGHQVTIAADYLGRTDLNTNLFQLTKTADTLLITAGDIISDSDGGATSTVVTVTSDENYTYVSTGGLAYAAIFPLTFTSTDYVPGGNIWKRVAWSADTW